MSGWKSTKSGKHFKSGYHKNIGVFNVSTDSSGKQTTYVLPTNHEQSDNVKSAKIIEQYKKEHAVLQAKIDASVKKSPSLSGNLLIHETLLLIELEKKRHKLNEKFDAWRNFKLKGQK